MLAEPLQIREAKNDQLFLASRSSRKVELRVRTGRRSMTDCSIDASDISEEVAAVMFY